MAGARMATVTFAGVTVGVPGAIGLLLLCAWRRTRYGIRPECPVCGSQRGASVGQVGAFRNGYRCHTCGFLWHPGE
jgi:formate dehydrogenase maturation protein FdhE